MKQYIFSDLQTLANDFSKVYTNSEIGFGKCEESNADDQMFVVIESNRQLAQLNAFLNGYAGPVSSDVYLSGGETLQSQLKDLRAEESLHPSNTHIKRQIVATLNEITYKEYLHDANFDEVLDFDDLGISWGYSDEYNTCAGCSCILRTSPDSYGWSPPFFVEDEGGYICEECCEDGAYDESVLESCKNDNKAIPDFFDLDRLGLVKINEETLQNGWYGGQTDDPDSIIEALNNSNIDVWFTVQTRQFDLDFEVYVKSDNKAKAIEVFEATDITGEDPAVVLSNALRNL